MAESYVYLYCVENSIRIFIDKVLRDKFGAKYFRQINTNRSIKDKVKSRKEQENRNQWLPARGHIDIFYLDFGDLGNIIRNN